MLNLLNKYKIFKRGRDEFKKVIRAKRTKV